MTVVISGNQTTIMIKSILIFFITLLGFYNATAQNSTGRIVDAENGQSLPYAGILINETDNIIGNAEGYFTIPEKHSEEVLLTVSFLGYKTVRLTLGELKRNDFIIKLQPGAFELESVYISNIKINADSIMAAVRSNIKRNYKFTVQSSKRTLFYRETSVFKPITLKAEMTESTGYKKKELNDSNESLKAFTSKLLSHPPQEFADMLCNYYSGKKMVDDKPTIVSKLEVVKAVKLTEKSQSVNLDELETMASDILYKHLDPTKHYRVKSGLFGTHDTVISPNHFFGSKKNVKKNHLGTAKSNILSFIGKTPQSPKFDFINQYELYEYTYAGTIQSGNNESVYIIKFIPKKRKGKYAGTLYVSEKDYAVVRIEYALSEGKTLGGVNLKFLLGIKQSENIGKGTFIFKEKANSEGYYLQYGSVETGGYIYINRPLKFIEITKGNKDVVAFDLKVEANVVDKEEYFLMSQSDIPDAEVEKANESELDYQHLDKYDATIWKEYNVLEPMEEMKQFRATE